MVEDECLVSVLRAVFSVSKQQTCETTTQFRSGRHQAALSVDQRIVRQNETRTSEFGDEHAFVIGDVKTFAVVSESCAFNVTEKIDGHGVGEEKIEKGGPDERTAGTAGADDVVTRRSVR